MASNIPLEHLPRIMRGGYAFTPRHDPVPNDRFEGAPVQYRIGPSRLETVTVWAGLIVASWALVYFAAQMLRLAF